MAADDIPWLGVQVGGLRVMSRSGQGLSGMAEEFDELMTKILKEEMMQGICAKACPPLTSRGQLLFDAWQVFGCLSSLRVLA